MGVPTVRVMTPRGVVLLASDVSHNYVNFLGHEPFRITVDVMATLRSSFDLVKLARAVDRIIPGNDPKVQTLFPSQSFNGVGVTALHESPSPCTLEELARIEG